MNIFLWIIQIFLAGHTALGAIWKFANSEQAVASLQAIPHGAWMALAVLELVATLFLVAPVWRKSLWPLAPIGALAIAAEMLAFCAVHLASGDPGRDPLIYWLVVAAFCAFLTYGRLARR